MFPWLAGAGEAASGPCWARVIADTDEATRDRSLTAVAQFAAEHLTDRTFGQLFPDLPPELDLLPLALPTRVVMVLERHNVAAADLASLTLGEFTDWHGVGPGIAGALLRHLAVLSVSPPSVVIHGAAPAGTGRLVRTGRDLDVAALVAEAVERLEPRTLQVLSARLLAEPPSLDQLGAEHGVTRERIWQIETGAHGKLLSVVPLALVAESARSLVGTLAPLDDLLAAMPALAQTVPGLDQPAWRVMQWLDGTYEISDGWCAAPSLRAAAAATRKQLLERADDCGVVRMAELDLVQCADPASRLELTASWLRRLGCVLHGGCVLTRTRTIADYGASLLSVAGKPLSSREITDRFGTAHTLSTVRKAMRADDRLERIDTDRWALKAWDLGAYAGIRRAIAEQIAQYGGEVALDALIEYLTSRFSVTASSVTSYATAPPFRIRAGMISHTERHRAARKTPQQTRRLFRHDGAWRYRVRVTTGHLKGSGSPAPTAIAGILGLHSGQTRQLDCRDTKLDPQTFSWARPQPSFGTIRRFLTGRDGGPDVAPGTDVFLVIADDGTFDCEPARELTGDPLTDALSLAGAPETAGPGALAIAIGLPPGTPMASVIAACRNRGDTDIADLLTGVRGELAG